MDTKIKICGLRRECDIDYANELQPDFIGFIFAKKSYRYVPYEQAGLLRSRLKPGIAPVGVFVNEQPQQVAELLNCGIIDIAQLHGQEGGEYIKTLRTLTDRPLIQAFRIETEGDVKRAETSIADYILLDHGTGGTGEAFDWSLLGDVRRPFFLAGGLTPENAGEALKRTNPFAMDVSSGVETDRVKDFGKMKRFIETVRSQRG